MTAYLDCNATTPIEPRVRDLVIQFLDLEFGNAGSRTHDYGLRAKRAVQRARGQVAEVVRAQPDEVLFTSGATESNNLAILGLEAAGRRSGRLQVITSQIEHKAVLEPLEVLEEHGFEIVRLPCDPSGGVPAEAVAEALRDDTLLVSVMHVNNETGVIQPVEKIAALLRDHPAYFHVDAAQGFGKELAALREHRIDLISVSGHKVYGPKGVGALVARRRGFQRPPLKPLFYGGGQERGLRPGTLPVHLIVGLGLAAELGAREAGARRDRCLAFREELLRGLGRLEPLIHGDPERTIPHTVNLSFPGLDSEAVMVAVKDLVAISNGSACTSQSYTPSHVLKAMGMPRKQIAGALRISWSHLTGQLDWEAVATKIASLR